MFAVYLLQQIKEKQASDLYQEHMQLMEEYLKTEDENEKKIYLKKIKGLASPVADSAKQLCHNILRSEGNETKRNKIQ